MLPLKRNNLWSLSTDASNIEILQNLQLSRRVEHMANLDAIAICEVVLDFLQEEVDFWHLIIKTCSISCAPKQPNDRNQSCTP